MDLLVKMFITAVIISVEQFKGEKGLLGLVVSEGSAHKHLDLSFLS